MENNTQPANRQQLLNEIEELNKQRKKLHGILDAMDHDAKIEEVKKYVGKYYKQKDDHNKTYHRCVFIYGIDEKEEKTISLAVCYWADHDQFYALEYVDNFSFERWPEDKDQWQETTKQEFDKHYVEVEKRINSARGVHTIIITNQQTQ